MAVLREGQMRITGLVLTTGLIAAAVHPVLAGGFYIQEQNAAGLGRAQAGDVAVADDASTLHFNPAGMTELPGLQAAGAIDVIIPSAKLTDRGSVDHSLGALLSNPASGGNVPPGGSNGGDPGSATPVANFYTTYQIPATDLTVGIGMSA